MTGFKNNVIAPEGVEHPNRCEERGNQSETEGGCTGKMSSPDTKAEENVALKQMDDSAVSETEDVAVPESKDVEDNNSIVQPEMEEVAPKNRLDRILHSYASFLVLHPFVVVLITIAAVIFSIVLGFVEATGAKPKPDFTDPLKGVEARGTKLSSRFMALQNLQEYIHPRNHSKGRKSILTIVDLPLTGNPYNLEKFMESLVIVYEHEDKRDLFPYMTDLCKWYKDKVETLDYYKEYVRFVHHIPNYIAWLNNKTDCEFITKDDTNNFKSLLTTCVGFYKNNSFLACKKNKASCSLISRECLKVNQQIQSPQNMSSIFYNVFHFLTGKTFQDNPTVLKITSVAAVLRKIDKAEENLFKPLYDNELEDISDPKFDGVNVVAFTMWGFKPWMFGQELIVQCFYCFIAVIFVVLLTWFYAKSFFIGFTTFFCILVSLIISYFVYGRIYDLDFFPFININTLIFIIGIGADDVFVYTQVWKEAQQTYKIRDAEQHIEYLIKWTNFSLRHAIVAMLVTSLTTAVSFFSNLTSSVTAVKCFGLYSATTIIVNYLLMITYLPCAVIVHDRYLSNWMNKLFPHICRSYPIIPKTKTDVKDNSEEESKRSVLNNFGKSLGRLNKFLFTDFLPDAVCRFKYIHIIVLSLLAIGSCVIVFHKPGLHPPVGGTMQMFQNRTSIEKYDMQYKSKFDYSQTHGELKVKVYFVFGVEPEDNGNKFDPEDVGTLEFKSPLDLDHLQNWLLEFCTAVTGAHFYEKEKNCGCAQALLFNSWISRQCKSSNESCCRHNDSIVQSTDFLSCLIKYVITDKRKGKDGMVPVPDKSDNSLLRAMILPVSTKYVYTMEFDYNRDATQTLDDWTSNEMKNAPSGNLKGWWTGGFNFFDLQESLDDGTFMSVGCAVVAALVVILVTSMNYILSIYSVVTIVVIITMTMAALVLDGWHLNIIEASVFSVAAGLSADFTLHYSVAYRSSRRRATRIDRVTRSLEHVGAPIVMGAITTFIGGLVMMPSTIRGFVQIGEFLMIVMMFSWIFSTFFFLPLLASIGPRGYSGEMRCGKKKNKMKRLKENACEDNAIENMHTT